MKKSQIKIPVAEPDLSGNEAKYTLEAIEKEGRVSCSGKYIERFENFGKEYFQREYAVSCSNGTAALHLALQSLDLKAGDEVIVPAFTFASVASSVLHCGAKPVFVDVSSENWNLNVAELDKKITEKTKTLIVVDSYGMPCDYDFLVSWCKKNKLFLIEDAAEAHGARFKGRPAGSFGDISCFSFYGNKIITSGEGGMCLTDNESFYKKMMIFKNHGRRGTGIYDHEVAGYNYRLTNVQAAIGCAQFERFEEFLAKRRKIAGWYQKYLAGAPVTFQSYDENEMTPVCWLFSMLIENDPQELSKKLAQAGIETRLLFKPLYYQKPFEVYAKKQKFPVADYIHAHGLSLPSSVKLTEKQVKFICENINKFIE